MSNDLKGFRLFFFGFLALNGFWLLLYVISQSSVIPSPIEVYRYLPNLIVEEMPLHIYHSLKRIFIALALSLGIGMPLGILMGYSEKINQLLYPIVYFSYPIPKTALLPVAMLLMGMRDGSKITIILLILVFQIIVAARDSVLQIDEVMYHVVKSVGANKMQTLIHVTIPAILPNILTTVRISLGTAMSVLFFIEGYGTSYGMGYFILDSWSRIDYIKMYSGILILSLVGFLLFFLMDRLQLSLCKWNNKK